MINGSTLIIINNKYKSASTSNTLSGWRLPRYDIQAIYRPQLVHNKQGTEFCRLTIFITTQSTEWRQSGVVARIRRILACWTWQKVSTYIGMQFHFTRLNLQGSNQRGPNFASLFHIFVTACPDFFFFQFLIQRIRFLRLKELSTECPFP